MKIECKDDQLMVTDFDAIEAFKIACKIERDGIAFYKKIAEAEKDTEAKMIFEYLAYEEEKHLAFFQECLDQVRKESDEQFEDDDMFSCLEYGVFEVYKNVEQLETLIADTKMALKLGVQVEKRSLQFYAYCRDAVSDDVAKQAIDKIIQEEGNHMKKIAEILHSFEKNQD